VTLTKVMMNGPLRVTVACHHAAAAERWVTSTHEMRISAGHDMIRDHGLGAPNRPAGPPAAARCGRASAAGRRGGGPASSFH
jgi:hypothetical protein